jgi:hypothetical protein
VLGLLLRVLVVWPLLVEADLLVLIAIQGLRRLRVLQLLLLLHLPLTVLLHVGAAGWQGGCHSLMLGMRLMVVMLCCTPRSRARRIPRQVWHIAW